MTLNRRDWLQRGLLLAAAAAVSPAHLFANKLPRLVIYKSPTCGCCTKWVDHVKAAGFETTIHDLPDVNPIKQKYGVPANLYSCHTVLAAGYVLEGHVPADVIKKLITQKPKIAGLAVPGMPLGSPGMEIPGRKEKYDVIAFQKDGKTSVFARM